MVGRLSILKVLWHEWHTVRRSHFSDTVHCVSWTMQVPSRGKEGCSRYPHDVRKENNDSVFLLHHCVKCPDLPFPLYLPPSRDAFLTPRQGICIVCAVFINSLITRLKECKAGCWIECYYYYRCLLSADDISIT